MKPKTELSTFHTEAAHASEKVEFAAVQQNVFPGRILNRISVKQLLKLETERTVSSGAIVLCEGISHGSAAAIVVIASAARTGRGCSG